MEQPSPQNKENSIAEQRNFLLAAAAWQDSLLQSYRTFHVTIQGFLVATGSAVLAVQLTGVSQVTDPTGIKGIVSNIFITSFIAFLFYLQYLTTKELSKVISNRASDINHWHKEIMLLENGLDSRQRVFTYFKIWQQARRGKGQDLPEPALLRELSSGMANSLIGNGIGHTRNILDKNLFDRLQHLWLLILLISIGISVWFICLQ